MSHSIGGEKRKRAEGRGEVDAMVEGMAARDGGAASVLGSAMRIRKYAVYLVECGYNPDNMEAFPCVNGYGNSKAAVTTACALLPAVIGEEDEDPGLHQGIQGSALLLVGRSSTHPEEDEPAADFASWDENVDEPMVMHTDGHARSGPRFQERCRKVDCRRSIPPASQGVKSEAFHQEVAGGTAEWNPGYG